ncbi:uncharacterized protein LOC123398013 [Hordeum vulgare subsp. vulgare]|uniref:Uncharacterized protein n=1 Tax=Hordeum vulgare subsp. vulgare TaxID=112509 RepID=A0A8I6XYI4_HORVV|nr:uncharacterized protein LOC123398013 [Hordeum vulgare subsp. vulgare]KAI4992104.1 hypothetical protein ZWY2020_041967 [Hordeum vulgare]
MRPQSASALAATTVVFLSLICIIQLFVSVTGVSSFVMDNSPNKARPDAAAAADNPEVVLPDAVNVEVDSVPAVDHEHPDPGDVLAWAYRQGQIHADPLMQRVETIGALLDMELQIVPPMPHAEILAALDELAMLPMPTIDPAPVASQEMDIDTEGVEGDVPPPPPSP